MDLKPSRRIIPADTIDDRPQAGGRHDARSPCAGACFVASSRASSYLAVEVFAKYAWA